MKNYTLFRPLIFSRHPSHELFRRKYKNISLLPFKSVVRFGSTTQIYNNNRIELNTVEGIKNSANKLLMKQCFTENNVKTADWFIYAINKTDNENYPFFNIINKSFDKIENLPYPIISKHIKGSRGTGNIKHDNLESLQQWMEGKNLDNYIFEKYYNYTREYRLHVNSEGCFYTCRKMLKNDTPQNKRWFRNDEHCIWALENNPQFDKPVNWDDIVNESIKALKAVKLDFGAIDLRIQSAKNNNDDIRENPKFIIIEINSAPSMGEITLQKYMEEIPAMLKRKYNNLNN